MATTVLRSYLHGQCEADGAAPCTSNRVYLTQDRKTEEELLLCYYHLKIYRGRIVPTHPVMIAGTTYKSR